MSFLICHLLYTLYFLNYENTKHYNYSVKGLPFPLYGKSRLEDQNLRIYLEQNRTISVGKDLQRSSSPTT